MSKTYRVLSDVRQVSTGVPIWKSDDKELFEDERVMFQYAGKTIHGSVTSIPLVGLCILQEVKPK